MRAGHSGGGTGQPDELGSSQGAAPTGRRSAGGPCHRGGAEAVESAVTEIEPAAICARQAEQLGTGHAVLQAKDALEGFEGDVIVLYGDTPFISEDTLENLRAARATHDIVMLGFEAADPGRYGRLIMEGERLTRIVEARHRRRKGPHRHRRHLRRGRDARHQHPRGTCGGRAAVPDQTPRRDV